MGNNHAISNVRRVIEKTTAVVFGVTSAKETEGKSLISDENK